MNSFSIRNNFVSCLRTVRKLILPSLTLFSFSFSLLAVLVVLESVGSVRSYRDAQVFLSQRENVKVTSLDEKGKREISGIENEPDINELFREYKRDNQSLKESTLKRSPSGKKTAFFQHKFVTDLTEINDWDYTYLVAIHEGREEPVFKSDFRLSSFEWLDDDQVVVYRNCGTECEIAYVVNIETKNYFDLPMGVGYTWSPDKKFVGSYHYSSRYGISLSARASNKYGRAVFQILREPPPNGSALINKTEIKWSPDSTKFALLIKKEDEEKLELMIFALIRDFSLLSKKTLAGNDSNFYWGDAESVIYEDDGKEEIVSI